VKPSEFLGPRAEVSEPELRRGVRDLMWDAAFASGVGAINSGVVLAAFALHLGAPNLVIGMLAAAPFWSQLIQAPTVSLVERVRRRRQICIAALAVGRLALAPLIVLPFLHQPAIALTVLIVAIAVHYGFNAVCTCSWNSWIRDLIPERELGAFTARRSSYVAAVTLIGSLVAGVALDRPQSLGGQDVVFAGLYAAGFACGIMSTFKLASAPEPMMAPPGPPMHLGRLLRLPLRDGNFRQLMIFLSSWQFAVNLATPFITVYLLRQLGFGLTFVLALSVVSQLSNLAVLRGWGVLSDRFSNKSVLAVAAPSFIACIAALVVASQIENRLWAAAYLVVLHAFMGMASAGVGLASGNIALKLAPRGSATVYIAANSLITSAAAGAAPILGGVFADFFARRKLTLSLQWSNPGGVYELLPIELVQWDFYFLIAAVLGLYALHRLTMVKEQGEIENQQMVQEVLLQARRTVRNLSPVAGLRVATAFPSGLMIGLQRLRLEARRERLRARRRMHARKPSIPRASRTTAGNT